VDKAQLLRAFCRRSNVTARACGRETSLFPDAATSPQWNGSSILATRMGSLHRFETGTRQIRELSPKALIPGITIPAFLDGSVMSALRALV
jgi:hypothetical protein